MARASQPTPERTEPEGQPKDRPRREIPGSLPYLTSPGALKNVLAKIVTASVPEKFSQDYLATILGYSGGSYRQVIPILKRVGLLTGDGKPTDLYSRFRTDSGRPSAAYDALRVGFAELFKRNEHIYAATDQRLTDLIVEVTGLSKSDQIVSAIKSTFRVLSGYLPPGFAPGNVAPASQAASAEVERSVEPPMDSIHREGSDPSKLNLAYNINIVLPDTRDIEVFNAIFRSVREHLLR